MVSTLELASSSNARDRPFERRRAPSQLALGERICELMEMQELEECRQLRLIKRREHRQGVAFNRRSVECCA
jgi:hypothetical protein